MRIGKKVRTREINGEMQEQSVHASSDHCSLGVLMGSCLSKTTQLTFGHIVQPFKGKRC